MAVVIDATPGSPTANSFATVEEADAYHADNLYSDTWVTTADVEVKAKALITATRLIVNAIDPCAWAGWTASLIQRLPWPRAGAYYPNRGLIPSTIIPMDLKNATAEMAMRLIDLGQMPDAPTDTEVQSIGLKSMTAGPIKLDFDHESGGGEDYTALPDAVFAMIAYLIGNYTRGSINVPLSRA